MTTPVSRIVKLLTDAGYRSLKVPLTVASVQFEFVAALVGTGHSQDLILVADTVGESDQRIKLRIEGLARALDIVKSRRPLTLVLAGPRPQPAILEALARVCRVLPVGTALGPDADQALHDWLAVLLPLQLPQATDTLADPLRELEAYAGPSGREQMAAPLIASAVRGASEVEKTLCGLVAEPLRKADTGE